MLKKIILIIIIILSIFTLFSCQQKFDIEAETEAIKKVILAETKAFVELRSFEEFAKTWVHEPYSLWISAGDNAYYELAGWDTIHTEFKNWLEDNPEPGKPIIKENFTFRIWGKGAWVFFEEYVEGKKAEDPSYIPAREFRVLEKTKAGWKIIFVGAFDKNSYKIDDTEKQAE